MKKIKQMARNEDDKDKREMVQICLRSPAMLLPWKMQSLFL